MYFICVVAVLQKIAMLNILDLRYSKRREGTVGITTKYVINYGPLCENAGRPLTQRIAIPPSKIQENALIAPAQME